MKVLCAVDTGKANTKGAIEFGDKMYTHLFPTRIYDADKKTAMSGDTVVKYEGKTYFVGTGDHNLTIIEHQSKLLPEHRVAAYTMVAKLFEEAGKVAKGEEIYLGVNVPIVEYLEPQGKDKYEKFFGDKEEISIQINGNKHFFIIKKVIPMFESSGVLALYARKFYDKTVLVLDNGGKNSTYCLFTELKPQRDTVGSLIYGGNKLISWVRSKIQEITGIDFNDTRIQKIIEGSDYETLDVDEKIVVDGIVKDQLGSVVKVLKGKGVDLTRTPVLMTGGTSLLYEPYVNEFFPRKNVIISNDCIFDQVKGFLEKLKQMKLV